MMKMQSTALQSLIIILGGVSLALADKPPAFDVTSTPAAHGKGPVVTISGRLGFTYTAFPVVAGNTSFDLRQAVWTSRDTHPASTMFVAGNQPEPPDCLRISGGVFHGSIPLAWSWSVTHAFGGSALLTIATGQQIVEDARIHNMQDGWRPRETPEFMPRAYPNTGRFLMRRCYLTGIRDDCIENDEFIPGAVEDCLFDGVWSFFSEQNESLNGTRHLDAPTIGGGEDREIQITRSLVRLAITSGEDTGPGTWFKLHGYDSPNHQIVVTDCIFAIGEMPRSGWKRANFPKDASFKGINHLLWLGEPGMYKAKVPEGLVFLEGKPAWAKWVEARNEWLARHGYALLGPGDVRPMEAKVEAPKQK